MTRVFGYQCYNTIILYCYHLAMTVSVESSQDGSRHCWECEYDNYNSCINGLCTHMPQTTPLL